MTHFIKMDEPTETNKKKKTNKLLILEAIFFPLHHFHPVPIIPS